MAIKTGETPRVPFLVLRRLNQAERQRDSHYPQYPMHRSDALKVAGSSQSPIPEYGAFVSSSFKQVPPPLGPRPALSHIAIVYLIASGKWQVAVMVAVIVIDRPPCFRPATTAHILHPARIRTTTASSQRHHNQFFEMLWYFVICMGHF